MGDYYIGRPLPTLHKCIPNHLTGDACRTIEPSNRHIPTSAGSSRTSTRGPGTPFQQAGVTWCQSPVTSDQPGSVRIARRKRACKRRVHMCMHALSAEAVTRCVPWKAPDVGRLLMPNKEAQLGQKANEANARERRVEWGKEGISLKEIMEGWGQALFFFFKWLQPEGRLNSRRGWELQRRDKGSGKNERWRDLEKEKREEEKTM